MLQKTPQRLQLDGCEDRPTDQQWHTIRHALDEPGRLDA